MKISLGMPIPDLGSLPGSRPGEGGGGGSTLFKFTTSSVSQSDATLACGEPTDTGRYKSTSPSTPVAVGDIIFREAQGTTYPAIGFYRDPLAGYYKISDDGEVVFVGDCPEILSFDSTTVPESNNETICSAVVAGKMYKLGSDALAEGDIVYKDVEGTETADEGFYHLTTEDYYEVDGAGEVQDIQSCN